MQMKVSKSTYYLHHDLVHYHTNNNPWTTEETFTQFYSRYYGIMLIPKIPNLIQMKHIYTKIYLCLLKRL